MSNLTSKEIFDPGDYDPHFSFSLSLSFTDYLLISLYLLFIAPLEALLWLVKTTVTSIAGLVHNRDRGAGARSQGGLASVFSKLF